MATFGSTLSQKREKMGLTLDTISGELHIKKELLQALENTAWDSLPEPAFVQGFIKNYSDYLGLDSKYMLALYRREYDPKKYPQTKSVLGKPQKFFLTPTRLATIGFTAIILAFALYLAVQYTSILSSPKLDVFTPSADETTTVPAVLITGQAEKGSTVSINGEFAPVDTSGNFSYQYQLQEGHNIIEIIAAKRLSPKTKVIRIIRLSP